MYGSWFTIACTNSSFANCLEMSNWFVEKRDYMLNQDLKNAIQTLPSRNGTTTGKVLLRCVSSNNSSYIPVTLGTSNYNMIMSDASSRNWNIVWDSGVNY